MLKKLMDVLRRMASAQELANENHDELMAYIVKRDAEFHKLHQEIHSVRIAEFVDRFQPSEEIKEKRDENDLLWQQVMSSALTFFKQQNKDYS